MRIITVNQYIVYEYQPDNTYHTVEACITDMAIPEFVIHMNRRLEALEQEKELQIDASWWDIISITPEFECRREEFESMRSTHFTLDTMLREDHERILER